MPSYSVEVPPELIVHWLIGALSAGPLKNAMRATREYVAREDFDLDRAGLSGSDDIDAVVAVGTLEVEAAPPAGGWTLKVRIEDSLGDRLPEDEPAQDEPEDIDLEEFWVEFIAPGRGIALAELEADSSAARARFERFVAGLKPRADAR